jgi:hypothetical protein
MLGIGEKLGDTMSDLALIAVPSLLKCHSRTSEASEKGVYLHDIAGIWNSRTHCWHSWSRERGNSILIEGDRVDVLLQLTQYFQCQTRRLTERLDNKSISGRLEEEKRFTKRASDRDSRHGCVRPSQMLRTAL